jgi:hypothetical protein
MMNCMCSHYLHHFGWWVRSQCLCGRPLRLECMLLLCYKLLCIQLLVLSLHIVFLCTWITSDIQKCKFHAFFKVAGTGTELNFIIHVDPFCVLSFTHYLSWTHRRHGWHVYRNVWLSFKWFPKCGTNIHIHTRTCSCSTETFIHIERTRKWKLIPVRTACSAYSLQMSSGYNHRFKSSLRKGQYLRCVSCTERYIL